MAEIAGPSELQREKEKKNHVVGDNVVGNNHNLNLHNIIELGFKKINFRISVHKSCTDSRQYFNVCLTLQKGMSFLFCYIWFYLSGVLSI